MALAISSPLNYYNTDGIVDYPPATMLPSLFHHDRFLRQFSRSRARADGNFRPAWQTYCDALLHRRDSEGVPQDLKPGYAQLMIFGAGRPSQRYSKCMWMRTFDTSGGRKQAMHSPPG